MQIDLLYLLLGKFFVICNHGFLGASLYKFTNHMLAVVCHHISPHGVLCNIFQIYWSLQYLQQWLRLCYKDFHLFLHLLQSQKFKYHLYRSINITHSVLQHGPIEITVSHITVWCPACCGGFLIFLIFLAPFKKNILT